MPETSPTTRLEAVNYILGCIGKGALQSLEQPHKNPDAELAIQALVNAVRNTLQRGLWFNTEKNYLIDPDGTGQIILPANTLRVDTVHTDKQKDLVQRGNKLWDRVNHTFAIGTAVKLDLVVNIAFEELPESARWFATCRAARRFVRGRQSSEITVRLTAQDEQDAQITMEQEDSDADDRTMAQASPHVARMRRGQR